MEKNIRKYLLDILECIEGIDLHLGYERKFELLETNRTVRSAIEREFEIIAEATNRILRIEPDFPLPNSREIIGMRNRINHEYDRIDIDILWKTIIDDIPNLEIEVRALIE